MPSRHGILIYSTGSGSSGFGGLLSVILAPDGGVCAGGGPIGGLSAVVAVGGSGVPTRPLWRRSLGKRVRSNEGRH